MLITHVGKRAIDGQHLVEATHAADLNRTIEHIPRRLPRGRFNRANPEQFMACLDEAEKAFCVVADILDGQPSANDIQALPRIVTPLRTDDQEIRRLM